MHPHELIDQDEPRCPYCYAEADVSSNSQWLPNTNMIADTEALYCRKCKECFWIHSWQGYDGGAEIIGFTFTCEDFSVFFSYIEGYFDVSDKNRKYLFTIPSFPIDFSNKDQLNDKLKTYLLFS